MNCIVVTFSDFALIYFIKDNSYQCLNFAVVAVFFSIKKIPEFNRLIKVDLWRLIN